MVGYAIIMIKSVSKPRAASQAGKNSRVWFAGLGGDRFSHNQRIPERVGMDRNGGLEVHNQMQSAVVLAATSSVVVLGVSSIKRNGWPGFER